MKRAILILSLMPACLVRAADPPPSPPAESEPSRLKEMEARIDALELTTTGTTPRRLHRFERAVLRYTNPLTSATAQGATFLWLDGKRPAAAISCVAT